MKVIDKKALERYRKLCTQIAQFTDVDLFETDADKKTRITTLRKDYGAFIKYYFPHYCIFEPADFHIAAAKKVRKNRNIALLAAWGRGLAKSVTFDILIPVWLWANSDLKVMLLVGNTEAKAKKLLSDIQAEFESNQRLINDYGKQVSHGNWADGNFITSNDCAFFCIGMGQSPRGARHRQFRPDYIVWDDLDDKILCKNPRRVKEMAKWIVEDLMPCGSPNGNRNIGVNNIFAPYTIMTELRDGESGSGFIFAQQNATDDNLNPLWVGQPKSYYDKMMVKMGSISFHSEYNNRPMISGAIFKPDMIQWGKMPRLDSFAAIVGHWDVAYSGNNDYNAVKVWGIHGRNFWCIKAFVRKTKMADPIRWMIDFEQSLPKTVCIRWMYESQFWNDALMSTIEQVEREIGKQLNIGRKDRPKSNKLERMLTMHPYYQNGRIYYNANERDNNDMNEGLSQLYAIEPGYKTHDDSPDSDEAAISELATYINIAVNNANTTSGGNRRQNRY